MVDAGSDVLHAEANEYKEKKGEKNTWDADVQMALRADALQQKKEYLRMVGMSMWTRIIVDVDEWKKRKLTW